MEYRECADVDGTAATLFSIEEDVMDNAFSDFLIFILVGPCLAGSSCYCCDASKIRVHPLRYRLGHLVETEVFRAMLPFDDID